MLRRRDLPLALKLVSLLRLAAGTDPRQVAAAHHSGASDRRTLDKEPSKTRLHVYIAVDEASAIVGNDRAGSLHTNTKLSRAHARNARLINETIREARDTDLVAPNRIQLPTLVGKSDMPCLCRTLQAVDRGL
jgi:hypothetical protein